MKKQVLTALVVAASPLLLAGCGSQSSQSASTSSSSTSDSGKLFKSSKSSKTSSTKKASDSSSPSTSSSASSTSSATKSASTQAPTDANRLGLRVYYTMLKENGWSDDRIQEELDNHTLSDISVSEVSGDNVASNYSPAVTRTFPANTYSVLATPLADGGVTYQVIDDNTVRVFNVPLHFQDERWANDGAWAKKEANSYMDHPRTMQVQTPSDDLLNQMQTAKTTYDTDDSDD